MHDCHAKAGASGNSLSDDLRAETILRVRAVGLPATAEHAARSRSDPRNNITEFGKLMTRQPAIPEVNYSEFDCAKFEYRRPAKYA